MFGAVLVARTDPHGQVHLAPAHGGKAVPSRHQIARDQREQIRRLGPRIGPFGPVRPVVLLAACGHVAVRQQDREIRLRPAHPHVIARQHVGPVGEEGDAAEPFRLALGAQHPVRGIEPHQLAVGRGVQMRLDRHLMRVAGQRQQQVRSAHAPALGGLAVDHQVHHRDIVAAQVQRLVARRIGVLPHRQRGSHLGQFGAKFEFQRDVGHQPRGRLIIEAADRVGRRRLGRGVGQFGVAGNAGGVAGDIHNPS